MTRFLDDIRTARCRIAPLALGDVDALTAITDATVTARIHFLPEPFTQADARKLIVQGRADNRFYGIRACADGALLGVVGVHGGARGRDVEIGYWLASDARGRGLASEVLAALMPRLALDYPACRIVAECHPENGRSQALLERMGFVFTGQAGRRPGRVVLARSGQAPGRIDVC